MRADSDYVALRIFLDCALCGAIGVASGFALFILSWEQTSAPKFLITLFAIAAFASAFEYVRNVIQGEEHQVSLSRSVIGLFLVAAFELFITAIHSALTADDKLWGELGKAVLGPVLAKQHGAIVNIVSMTLVWVVMGTALGAGLSFAIKRPDESDAKPTHSKGFGALVGALTGAIGAPLAVAVYIVIARFVAEIGWMIAKPQEWTQNAGNLADRIPTQSVLIPLKLTLMFTAFVGGRIPYAWGPFAAIGGVTAMAVIVFAATDATNRNWFHYSLAVTPIVLLGAPLLGSSLLSDLRLIGWLFLLVAVIWFVPGLLLGTLVPYLRTPAEHRRFWAFIAWGAAAAMVLFVPYKWLYVIAALLIAAGISFWKGLSFEAYWPFIALSLAASVLTVTKIGQSVNFLDIQAVSRKIVEAPLARVSPSTHSVFSPELNDRLLKSLRNNPLVFNPDIFKNFDLPPLGQPVPLGQSALNRLMSQYMRTDEWMKDATARLASGKHAFAEAEILIAKLRRQEDDNQKLAHQPDGLQLRDMPEIAQAQVDTGDVLGKVSAALSALEAEEKESKKIVEKPTIDFATIFNLESKPDPDEMAKRQELTVLIKNLVDDREALREASASLKNVPLDFDATMNQMKAELTKRFELCMNGSLGFWIPLGLLAGWARSREASEPAKPKEAT